MPERRSTKSRIDEEFAFTIGHGMLDGPVNGRGKSSNQDEARPVAAAALSGAVALGAMLYAAVLADIRRQSVAGWTELASQAKQAGNQSLISVLHGAEVATEVLANSEVAEQGFEP